MGVFKRLVNWESSVKVPIVSSDDIYPVHRFDDAVRNYTSSPNWLIYFNDVLDADKLHTALARVLEIDHWRKLGCRIRRNEETGKLELHVPRPFTAERPAVAYTHVRNKVAINDHPLGRQLPKRTSQPSVHYSSSYFDSFRGRPGLPSQLADYLGSTASQLSLHITSFTDATVVAISWSHLVMDAMGLRALVAAWCQVLAGHEAAVPAPLGSFDDVGVPLSQSSAGSKGEKEEPYIGEARHLRGLRLAMFGASFLWEVVKRPRVGGRTIFLPAAFVDELRRKALLATGNSFISDGDLLSAWIAQLIVWQHRWRRPVTLLNVVDIRSRVPSVFGKDDVYLQNLIIPSFCHLPKGRTISSRSLGSLAMDVRQSILESTTEAQVRALLRKCGPGRMNAFFCSEPNALLVIVSNWQKAKFPDLVDFSPALVCAGEQGQQRCNPPGKMLYHLTSVVRQTLDTRDSVVIMGKDHAGNYWINLYGAKRLLGRIHDYVDMVSKDQ